MNECFYKNLKLKEKASIEAINDFQLKNNLLLSESYKDFLLNANGAYLNETFLETELTRYSFILASFNSISGRDLQWESDPNSHPDYYYVLKYLFLLPIARAVVPEYELFIGVSRENLGKIYFYDSFNHTSNSDVKNAFTLIADDLSILINSFKEKVLPETENISLKKYAEKIKNQSVINYDLDNMNCNGESVIEFFALNNKCTLENILKKNKNLKEIHLEKAILKIENYRNRSAKTKHNKDDLVEEILRLNENIELLRSFLKMLKE
jgi:hypothetical protein